MTDSGICWGVGRCVDHSIPQKNQSHLHCPVAAACLRTHTALFWVQLCAHSINTISTKAWKMQIISIDVIYIFRIPHIVIIISTINAFWSVWFHFLSAAHARVQFLQFVTQGLIRFISRCTAERNESSLRREAQCGSKKNKGKWRARVWVRPRRRAKVRLLGLTHAQGARGWQIALRAPPKHPGARVALRSCIYTHWPGICQDNNRPQQCSQWIIHPGAARTYPLLDAKPLSLHIDLSV